MSASDYQHYLDSLAALSGVDADLTKQLDVAQTLRDGQLAKLKEAPETHSLQQHTKTAEQALSDGNAMLAMLDAGIQLPKKRRATSTDHLKSPNAATARRAVDDALSDLQQAVQAVQNHRKQQVEQERQRRAEELKRRKDEEAAAEAARRKLAEALALQHRRRIIGVAIVVGIVILIALLLALK